MSTLKRMRLRPLRRSLLGSAIATATTHLIFPDFAFGQSEKTPPIFLGQSAPLTGPLAKSAIAFRDAAKALFSDLNSRGGVSGRPVELITLDDQARSEVTATNIKLLASQHLVMGLFGFMGPGAHRIGAIGAQQEGLPYIAPVSGAAELRSSSMPWVYNLRAGHKDELQFITKHAQQIGLRRLAMLYEYNSQGWELRDALTERAKTVGLDDVALVSVDQLGSDFSIKDAVTTALQEKPHGIVLGADYAASGKFVRAARQAGFNGMFYALSTVGGQALMDQIGVESATGISVTQVVPFPWSNKTDVGRNFQLFCTKHKLAPSFEGMEAWLASSLLIDALQRAKPLTPAKLMAELDKSTARDFGAFSGALSNKSRSTAAFVDLTVYSRDGRFRT
jgi:branched-chain amino acid transport system substrate-binding protein